MTTEIRQRKVPHYINDYATRSDNVPEAVFGFTIEELHAIEGWVPWEDGFHKEIMQAIEDLEKLQGEK